MELDSKQEAILVYLYENDITTEMLVETTTKDLVGLPTPNGPLNFLQIVKLKNYISTRMTENERIRKENELLSIQIEEDEQASLAIADHIKATAIRQSTLCRNVILEMIANLKHLEANLEICFCMDGTGSMFDCLDNVRKCVVKAAKNIESSTGLKARFALVIYRDYSDGADRLQVRDFGSSSDIETYLATVNACGGGDEAEDCFGGLWAAATQVTWTAKSRIIVWLGDAPQHGKKYNSTRGDRYPNGDPDGRTASQIFQVLMKKKIILVFGRLKEATDAMIAQLRREEGGSNRFLNYNISECMEKFLSSTIHKVSSITFENESLYKEREKPYQLTRVEWRMDPTLWEEEEEAEIDTFPPNKIRHLHPLLAYLYNGSIKQNNEGTVQLTVNPVEKGEMRFAFFGYRDILWKNCISSGKAVVKESRFLGEHNTQDFIVSQIRIQTTAQFLAKIFNKKLKEAALYSKTLEYKEINYVSAQLLTLPKRPLVSRFFTIEPFIRGEYVKFSNNQDFVDRDLERYHPLLQTFSHFTYSYSNALVMVVDLQGVILGNSYKLTDPAIHTASKELLPDRTNLGKEGMALFFTTHRCNEYCRILMLKMQDDVIQDDDIDNQFGSETSSEMSEIGNIEQEYMEEQH